MPPFLPTGGQPKTLNASTEPLRFTLEGAAELVGPEVVTAEGGMAGTYLRTVGTAGQAKLTISCDQTEPVTILFQVNKR